MVHEVSRTRQVGHNIQHGFQCNLASATCPRPIWPSCGMVMPEQHRTRCHPKNRDRHVQQQQTYMKATEFINSTIGAVDLQLQGAYQMSQHFLI